MYFHKTTYRPVYAEALKAAQALDTTKFCS